MNDLMEGELGQLRPKWSRAMPKAKIPAEEEEEEEEEEVKEEDYLRVGVSVCVGV